MAENVIVNTNSLFFFTLFLLIGNIVFGVGKIVIHAMDENINPLYGYDSFMNMDLTGSMYGETLEWFDQLQDVLDFVINFIVSFFIAYVIFSSFYSRMTPLNFLMSFIFAILLSAVYNYLYILIYNNVIQILTSYSPLFSISFGQFLIQNLPLILVANMFAGAMAFLYSTASTRFYRRDL